MTKTLASLALALTLAVAASSAEARTRHINEISSFDRHALDGGGYVVAAVDPVKAKRTKGKRQKRDHVPTKFAAGMVTVPTAAGINITVAPSFAPKITGFIADLVARGYQPRRIHCYATGGHVRGSFHYRGEACDFEQRGWGKTAGPMYRVADLAAKHGLRDGCTFRDCGHIDAGVRYAARKKRTHYASAR